MRRLNSARRVRAKSEIDSLIHGLIASCDSDRPTQTAFVRLIKWARAHGNLTCVVDSARPGWRDVRSLLFAMLALCRHHRAWVREVEAWEPPTGSLWTQFGSLAQHLLARSSVPEFMICVWFERDAARAKVQQKLFKHLGRGGGIRGFDLQQLNRTLDNDHLRKGVIRQILKDCRWLPGALDLVVEFLAAQRREHFIGTAAITRHTPRVLLEQARRWRRERRAVHQTRQKRFPSISRSWPPLPIRGLFQHNDNRKAWATHYWTIRQLLNSLQLKKEGRTLRHCVGGYSGKCEQGETSIWSLRSHGALSAEPLLTITLNPETREIVYARGHRNSAPSAQACELLKLWAEREDLRINQQVLSL